MKRDDHGMEILRRRHAMVWLAPLRRGCPSASHKSAQTAQSWSITPVDRWALRWKAFFGYGIQDRVVETCQPFRQAARHGRVGRQWDVTGDGGQDAIRAVKMNLVEKIDDKIVDRSKYQKEGAHAPSSLIGLHHNHRLHNAFR